MNDSTLKFSCADFTFPLLDHRSALQLIHLLGIEAVDLGLFEGRSHLYPSEVGRDVAAAGKSLRKELDVSDLQVSDVFLQTGADPPIAAANSPEKDIRLNNREVFLRMIEFATTLDCRHLTGLPGVYHENQHPDADWDRAVEEAIWRTETAREAGVTYSVEPHVGSILPDAAQSLKFIDACPGLTLTLDYGHFIYQGQSNESVHPLISHASHVHVRGGAKGKLQTIVKDNEIDFHALVRQLTESAYSGYICMEYVYQDWEGCNRTDNVSETILLYNQLRNIFSAL